MNLAYWKTNAIIQILDNIKQINLTKNKQIMATWLYHTAPRSVSG